MENTRLARDKRADNEDQTAAAWFQRLRTASKETSCVNNQDEQTFVLGPTHAALSVA